MLLFGWNSGFRLPVIESRVAASKSATLSKMPPVLMKALIVFLR